MATAYQLSVTDLPVRRAEIDGKAKASIDKRPFYHLRNRVHQLPVIQVSLQLPVYRMENYRTQTRQLTHIRQLGLPENFFKNGQEDLEAQQAQHDILADLANEDKGHTVLAITTALGQDRLQTEPLLITHEGVVVNGNRRLAGMREMYQEKPASYPTFATIDVMVLPADVTQKELKEVEFRLQMQRETRLPYEWQDEALAVRDLFQQGVAKREIQALMRRDKEQEISAMLDQLQEAEVYLTEYLEKPNQYEHVREHDQLFGDLQAALAKLPAPQKEVARRLAHVMAKNSKSFGSRVYDYNPVFGKKCSQVVERLAEKRGIKLTATAGADEDIFGSSGESDPYAPVRDLLKDSKQSTELAKEIKEIYDDIREEDRDAELGRKAERSVQKANTLLNEVSLEQADPATYASIRSQLGAVIARAEGLLEDVNRRIADGATAKAAE